MLRNFTPHNVVVQLKTGDRVTFPSEGRAVAAQLAEPCQPIDGIPVAAVTYGQVAGIPDTVGDGDTLIVSSLALAAARATGHPLAGRMVAPDSGPGAIRENGQIVAVRGFVR